MIKGITPRLAEIGKIKIGRKGREITTKSGKKMRIPEKSDQFIITTTEKDANGDFVANAQIMSELGSDISNPLRELDIVLLFDDIDKNFITQYALYAGRVKRCSGDGEKAIRLIDPNKKEGTDDMEQKSAPAEYVREEMVCPCEYLKLGKCKPTGVLICLLKMSQRIGGVYVFRTHSWNSIVNMLSSLRFIQQLTGGILAGLPLKMTIKPKTVQEKNTDQIHKIYMVNIEYAGTAVELKQEAIKIAQIRSSSQINLGKYLESAKAWLEAPETEEEQADVNEEYSPETVDMPAPVPADAETKPVEPSTIPPTPKDWMEKGDEEPKKNEEKLF